MPHIFQLNISDGGVPKKAVYDAEVTPLGLVGDRQRNRRYHGGPERAVCVYSLERILALQAEGHPIFPGATGENVTLAGVEWTAVQPGVVLQLGDAVRLQVVSFAAPCRNIRHAFAGERFKRLSAKLHPGWARAYCRVLQPGQMSVGDPVTFTGGDQVATM